jgi:hypothetical protein
MMASESWWFVADSAAVALVMVVLLLRQVHDDDHGIGILSIIDLLQLKDSSNLRK